MTPEQQGDPFAKGGGRHGFWWAEIRKEKPVTDAAQQIREALEQTVRGTDYCRYRIRTEEA